MPKSIQSPQLGLVCSTDSEAIRYRTITRKRLLQHEPADRAAVLDALYRDNLARLENALAFCVREGIALYRVPSSLLPFADDPAGEDVMHGLADLLASIGELANSAGIRLVMHPEQFVVLSSDSSEVVANSVKILSMHATIMDLLAQPRSPWALIEVHGGKGDRSAALIDRIGTLPEAIRLRLGLENDEYAYSADDIHAVCAASGVPMVFDAHHHVIKEKLDDYEHPSVAEMLRKARGTWHDPSMQLVHISNGREAFGDRKHADLIVDMPSSYIDAPWIEIEAKSKEVAITHLRTIWPPASSIQPAARKRQKMG